MRLVVGISGATGAVYGVRLLELLAAGGRVETHLIITHPARRTIEYETERSVHSVESMATAVYDAGDVAAMLSSGSFATDGMVVVPCSVKTLSAIANSYNDNLLVRAADVTLKERRKLVLVVRETPLHLGHLRLMSAATEMGAVVFPPVPSFYNHPRTINDIVDQTVGRILDQFGLDLHVYQRWAGIAARP